MWRRCSTRQYGRLTYYICAPLATRLLSYVSTVVVLRYGITEQSWRLFLPGPFRRLSPGSWLPTASLTGVNSYERIAGGRLLFSTRTAELCFTCPNGA